MKWYMVQFGIMASLALFTLAVCAGLDVDILTLNKCMTINILLLIISGALAIIKTVRDDT